MFLLSKVEELIGDDISQYVYQLEYDLVHSNKHSYEIESQTIRLFFQLQKNLQDNLEIWYKILELLRILRIQKEINIHHNYIHGLSDYQKTESYFNAEYLQRYLTNPNLNAKNIDDFPKKVY